MELIVYTIGIIIVSIYGYYKGNRQARKRFKKEIKKIKLENPHIYFREIPNDYGIGVSSVLLDFNIKGKKILMASILDLCAKKYIRVTENGNGYIIEDLKKDTKDLLPSEIFVLEWALTSLKTKRKFDYKEWRRLSINDAINIGLVENRKTTYEKQKNREDTILGRFFGNITKLVLISVVSMILLFVSFIIYGIYWFELTSIISPESLDKIMWGVSILLGINILTCTLGWAIYTFCNRLSNVYVEIKGNTYNHLIKNTPIRTEKGNKELQELYAFGSFIKDFGNFADKHVNEIVIWERYLSYSQLFGFTNEIIKTGYSQLKNNECFVINSI